VAGGDFTGNVTVNGDIGAVRVSGSALGATIQARGSNIGSLSIAGSAQNLTIQADGRLGSTSILGDFVDSSIRASTLARVSVGGGMSGQPGNGHEIHADEGTFRFYNPPLSLLITGTQGCVVNNVQVSVG
jgi:hypothetical protein